MTLRKSTVQYLQRLVGNEYAEELVLSLESQNDAETVLITELLLTNALSFVWWALQSAVQQNIKHLYFMSRSGYILKKIADVLIDKYRLSLGCHYFYCSHQSLNIPAASLMGEEKYDLLLKGDYGISAAVLMDRLLITELERKHIYNDICFEITNENTCLSEIGRQRFTERLKSSEIFKAIVDEKCKNSLKNAAGYILQEDMTVDSSYGIVDMGWDTSLQQSLSILLECVEAKCKPIWFYFGLYNQLNNRSADEFNVFYFNKLSGLIAQAQFEPNLFDAVFGAPHPITITYAQKLGIFSPMFKKDGENSLNEQVKNARKLMEQLVSQIVERCEFNTFKPKQMLRILKKVNAKVIYRPTAEAALAFKDMQFFHGFSELNGKSLITAISEDNYNELKCAGNNKSRRRKKSLEDDATPLFWEYGSLALSDMSRRRTYRRICALKRLIATFKK